MAEVKRKKTAAKPKIGKVPSLRERITDDSPGAFSGPVIWTPKRKNGK